MNTGETRQVGKRELFDVTMDSGTVIKDCHVATKDDSKWIAGPSRSYVAKDGTTKWVNLVSFSKHDQEAIFASLLGQKVPERDVMGDMDDLDSVPF